MLNASVKGCPIRALHIPESQGSGRSPLLPARNRGNWLKTRPVVYCWTSGVGWAIPAIDEAVKMRAAKHKPVNHPMGALALQGE
ncbi:MAG: hypothetical protein ACP5LZ_00175 [Fervidicoccaceae archaeon]